MSNPTLPTPEMESVPRSGGALAARPIRALFYLFFPGGGIGRYTHELLKTLHADGRAAVELACLPSYAWRDQATYPLWPHMREIGHPVAWRRRLRFLTAQFASPRRLCQRARETRPDIVHLSNINYLTLPLWWAPLKRTGAKIVATAHDVRRAHALLNRRYETRQLREFYRRADALFVHSEPQKDDLLDFAQADPARVHLVPHGPYDYGRPEATKAELRQRFQLPQDKQVALFFGQIRDDKNLDLLLRALPAHRDRTHLLVAGRGEGGRHKGMDFYRQLIRELQIEDCVTLMDGYIPEEQVAGLFEASDWIALPYSRSFTSQSGVLNVATQYRRPVLLSSSPTFEETLGRCDVGLLVEPDSLAALSEGIAQMQARVDRGHAHQFDEYDRLFGWQENADRTLAVYRALLGSTSPQPATTSGAASA